MEEDVHHDGRVFRANGPTEKTSWRGSSWVQFCITKHCIPSGRLMCIFNKERFTFPAHLWMVQVWTCKLKGTLESILPTQTLEQREGGGLERWLDLLRSHSPCDPIFLWLCLYYIQHTFPQNLVQVPWDRSQPEGTVRKSSHIFKEARWLGEDSFW